jgi:hypothetical protein
MDYLMILIVTSLIVLVAVTVGVLVVLRNLRADILDRLAPEHGTMVETAAPQRRRPVVKRAPRIIDDASAAAIEQRQITENEGRYRS